MKQAVEN